MNAHDNEETWDLFAADATEALRLIEQSLLALEEAPTATAHVNGLYRGLHTLKGNASFVDLSTVELVAHAAEDLVGLVRDKGIAFDREIAALLYATVDALATATREVEAHHRDVPLEPLLPLIESIRAEMVARTSGTAAAPRSSLPVGSIPGFILFDDPPSVPPAVAPAPASIPGFVSFDDPPSAPATAAPAPASIPGFVSFDDPPAAATPAPATAPAAIPGFVSFDDPPSSPPASAPPTRTTRTSRPAPSPARPPAVGALPVANAKREERATEFLRVDAAKISALMDLANELGLACSAVTQHDELSRQKLPGFSAAAHKLELLVREMQTDLSSLRLVSVSPLFQRMRRVVRDASRRTDKSVELVLQGEDTEIDKVMIDALQDPLVHILRNAVDHGIEDAATRAAAGKPPVGSITLSALQQGGEVTIEVRDDGGGLALDRILARAKERGLCAPDATPTDAEIAEFIMSPGFSTKNVADALSGRGVGMDVVKTSVEALRGRVVARSTTGHGSLMRMTLPLTLAFVEALVVRKDERLIALPIEKVLEVSKLDGRRVLPSSAGGSTLIRVQNQCVPVLWLHRYWDEVANDDEHLDGRVVVVVQTSRGPLALPVDQIVGNQQVMLKPMRGLLAGIRAVSGCGMLRTGDVAVALDCERLAAA